MELKPTLFLKISIFISSLVIAFIGAAAYFSGNAIGTTCLTIPIFSFYIIAFETVKRKPVYYIYDIHAIFWWVLSGAMLKTGIVFLGTPFVMAFLFTVIIFKRKSNFVKIYRVGHYQTV